MQEATPSLPIESPVSSGPHPPVPMGTPGESPLADPRAMQILATEHWSLLATRSLAYNESFTRAGMFLSFLSATLIVIGFLIGAQGLSPTILPIAIVLLVADLFIGTATVGRLVDANREELQTVRGMNRIRHAYREMVPGLEPYFVSGFHDDALGVLATYGDSGNTLLGNVVHGLTTTIGMVAIIDSLVLAAICGLIATGLGADFVVSLGAAVLGFLAAFLLFVRIGSRVWIGGQASAESRFPTPADPQG